MPRLNDPDFASLLEETAHALRYDYPLPEMFDRLSNRRLGSIAKSAAQVAMGLRSGQPIAQAFSVIGSPLTPAVQAALTKAGYSSDGQSAASPTTSPNDWRLLQRMATMIHQRHDAKRLLRLALLYPCLLILIGYISIVTIAYSLLGEGQELGIGWPHWLLRTAQAVDAHPVLPLIVIIALMIVTYLVTGRSRWFSKFSSYSLFCFALADQCEAGINEPDAVIHAAMIANLSLPSSSDLSIKHPHIESIIRLASVNDGDLQDRRESDQVSVDSNDERSVAVESKILVDQLRLRARDYLESARRKQVFWSQIFPKALTILIGSSLSIGYVFFVIRPIYQAMGGL